MEFKKSGFNEEDSATLAGVAAMYQNVADDAISAGESANFIISQMKAFGLEAEDATHIIDALNEVSNTQAVSSADLANNLGKASAAMALGNNTYEQALSMMTAITEINRSGAKSARALVSVQSRLTQVLDEQSSTGKALVEIYNGLGIALKDQNGQLRPTFEIFKDLAAVWPNLTTNQRDYIALTQAGANQTSNFVALMDNFDAALKAEATAMESSGSAARENAAYMESLEAQTTQLKATFQDFANNVIDKELVSSILTLANDVLGALNTEVGSTITQWTLLTGVLTGGIVIYGQIAGKLLSAGSAVITLGKALSAGTATATMFTSAALPLAAAIGAIAVAGWKVYEWYKETHQPLSEYTSQIESNNEQLEKNKERLEEIEKLPWTEKTDEILAEKEALEQQNAELEKNIELNKSRGYDRASEQAASTITIEEGSHYTNKLLGIDWKTEHDAIESINKIYGEGTKTAKFYINGLEEVTDTFVAQGEALNTHLINELQKYNEKIMRGEQLSENEIRWRNNIIEASKTQAESYQFLQNSGDTLTESQQALIDVFDDLTLAESVAKNEMVALNQEGVSALLAKYPQLKSAIEDVNGVSYLNVTALEKVENATVEDKVAMYDLIAAQTVFNNSSLDVSSKIAQLAALAEQAGATAASIATVMGVSSSDFSRTVKGLVQTKQAKNEQEATQILLKRMYSDMLKTIPTSGDVVEGTPTYPSTVSSSKTTTKKATDLALEEFKNLQKDLEHQKELGLIKEKEYYDKLEQLVKDYKAKATAHMKEYGTDVDTINRNMYQYEEEIYKGRAKLADELKEKQKKDAEEAAQAQKEALEQQKEALEKQKEDFETAVNYVIKQIDEEISKLQDLRDQTEQYYDDKIDAVNKANDALEDQIQYEELLNNLAKAKDKQLYVFQNGQFQYAQDVEAIASAQAELDAYERDKALQDEINNLETLKEQALASIDEQIEGWENYKEEWSNVVNQYQDEQDRLIAEQVLGIDLEQENWNKRLSNLTDFVNQYNSILSGLNSGTGGSGASTSSGGGNGYHFDYSNSTNKATGYYDAQGNALTKGQVEDYVGTVGGKVYDSSGKSHDINTVTFNKHANGALSAPGGLSLVGERGPELRVLNSGDGIIPADATRNLWDWASYNPKDFMSGMGSDNIFHIGNIALPNVTDAKSFVNGLKQLAYQRAYKRA